MQRSSRRKPFLEKFFWCFRARAGVGVVFEFRVGESARLEFLIWEHRETGSRRVRCARDCGHADGSGQFDSLTEAIHADIVDRAFCA